MWTDRAVLVTGADGFIGSHLTEALVAEGARVTALALYTARDGHGWLDDLPAPVRGALRRVRATTSAIRGRWRTCAGAIRWSSTWPP